MSEKINKAMELIAEALGLLPEVKDDLEVKLDIYLSVRSTIHKIQKEGEVNG